MPKTFTTVLLEKGLSSTWYVRGALMKCFFSKGGFIFNTIHNIMPEVLAENILACFDAVKKFNADSP